MIASQMELKPPPAPPSETTSLPPTLFLFQVDEEVILENECVKKKKERKAKNGEMQPDYFLQHLRFMSISQLLTSTFTPPRACSSSSDAELCSVFPPKHNQTTARSRFRPYCCHCDYFSESHAAPGDTAAVSEGNK